MLLTVGGLVPFVAYSVQLYWCGKMTVQTASKKLPEMLVDIGTIVSNFTKSEKHCFLQFLTNVFHV